MSIYKPSDLFWDQLTLNGTHNSSKLIAFGWCLVVMSIVLHLLGFILLITFMVGGMLNIAGVVCALVLISRKSRIHGYCQLFVNLILIALLTWGALQLYWYIEPRL